MGKPKKTTTEIISNEALGDMMKQIYLQVSSIDIQYPQETPYEIARRYLEDVPSANADKSSGEE